MIHVIAERTKIDADIMRQKELSNGASAARANATASHARWIFETEAKAKAFIRSAKWTGYASTARIETPEETEEWRKIIKQNDS